MNIKEKIIEEVKLAKEETIMGGFQKERTDAITEMFDNKYGDGLYPTSKFFLRLDNALLKALSQQKQEIVEEMKNKIQQIEKDESDDVGLDRQSKRILEDLKNYLR